MTAHFGRDKHLFINAVDSADAARCIRCGRPKSEHAERAWLAGPYTYATVTQRDRERLADELAPNGLAFGGRR